MRSVILAILFSDALSAPCLQTLQGETFANKNTTTDNDARLDIKANSVLKSRFSRPFFEVKMFYRFAKSSQEACCFPTNITSTSRS